MSPSSKSADEFDLPHGEQPENRVAFAGDTTGEISERAKGTWPRDEGIPRPLALHRAPLFLLYLNVLAAAICGLVYELLAGTLASYVLGDSVTQFSLVIGVYLFAMGVGAYLSGHVRRNVARAFVEVELGVALAGGLSAPLLFLAVGSRHWFGPALYGTVFAIGALVGLEMPLLMRILKNHLAFGELVSRVLSFDYLGALVASVLFPLVLVPQLGLVRTSLAFGGLNAAAALWGTYLLAPLLRGSARGLRIRACLVIAGLGLGFCFADAFTEWAEERQFSHPIVHAQSTPYQRIVLTKSGGGQAADFELYLNGNLQFHSADEYRYHEALVHPPLLAAGLPRRVLVLGGGDGLAVREILKHDSVQHVTLVDIDPAMTGLAANFPQLASLNEGSLRDQRVEIVNDDAFLWIAQSDEPFDAVIIDFPDAHSYAVGKLYTTRFYRLLARRLARGARVSIQCTSPLSAPRTYWCIVRTLEAAGYRVLPYQAAVPSFGLWGYALAGLDSDLRPPEKLPPELAARLRFLNDSGLRQLFNLPADMQAPNVEVNRLNNQVLVRYHETEWSRWK